MTDMDALREEIVTANRILADNRVLDSFGHVSVRHPDHPDRFLLSRARAPEQIEPGDIMEFALTGEILGPDPLPGKPYSERFIHGAIYEARPDVNAVVHNHSPSVIPFSVTNVPMKPIMHMCAPIGGDIPNWDIRDKFGDCTNLLVTSLAMGRDLAETLGNRTVTLMRGHGSTVVGDSLRQVVFTSVYMEINADMLLRARTLGDVITLSDGEIEAITRARSGFTLERGWENWCRKVGRPYVQGSTETGPGYSATDPS